MSFVAFSSFCAAFSSFCTAICKPDQKNARAERLPFVFSPGRPIPRSASSAAAHSLTRSSANTSAGSPVRLARLARSLARSSARPLARSPTRSRARPHPSAHAVACWSARSLASPPARPPARPLARLPGCPRARQLSPARSHTCPPYRRSHPLARLHTRPTVCPHVPIGRPSPWGKRLAC